MDHMTNHSAADYLAALKAGQRYLDGLAGPLSGAELRAQSYASEWSVAQVLSHLGSGAVIFGDYLERSLAGEDLPGMEEMKPVWDEWNAKTPEDQRTDALEASAGYVERLASLHRDGTEVDLELFGMNMDLAMLARMRLGEAAVHSFDIAVAFDPSATVAQDASALLVDTLGQIAGWTGKSDGSGRTVALTTTDPDRHLRLDLGDSVVLDVGGASADAGAANLALPAESLIRLVYGRLDADHTPASVAATGFDLDELRAVFPGV
ncbi:MAG TPA: maleylpyruvate isomerase N-terminal domain-containing protein [Acidimicrobiales bacterium]|nr:maleylpyruvate isomerase N-terminal domain-containing protein [Acidimicrobiales bacterium]